MCNLLENEIFKIPDHMFNKFMKHMFSNFKNRIIYNCTEHLNYF